MVDVDPALSSAEVDLLVRCQRARRALLADDVRAVAGHPARGEARRHAAANLEHAYAVEHVSHRSPPNRVRGILARRAVGSRHLAVGVTETDPADPIRRN